MDADVAISMSLGKLSKYFDLSRAQGLCAQSLREVARNLRGDVPAATMDRADTRKQVAGRSGLQHIPARSRGERSLNLHVAFEGGQHHHTGIRELAADQNHGADAVKIR